MKLLRRPLFWIFNTPRRWPLYWVGLGLLGIGIGVLIYADRSHDHLVRQSAIERARAHALSLVQFRQFYEQALVPRAMRAGVPFTEDERSNKNALPMPATLMVDLGLHLAQQDGDAQVRFYSDVAMSGRTPQRELDAFQKQALQALRNQPEVPFVQEEILNGKHVLRYAQADRVALHCVACEPSEPSGANKELKPQEVMGVLEVVVPMSSSAVTSTGVVHRSLMGFAVALAL